MRGIKICIHTYIDLIDDRINAFFQKYCWVKQINNKLGTSMSFICGLFLWVWFGLVRFGLVWFGLFLFFVFCFLFFVFLFFCFVALQCFVLLLKDI